MGSLRDKLRKSDPIRQLFQGMKRRKKYHKGGFWGDKRVVLEPQILYQKFFVDEAMEGEG